MTRKTLQAGFTLIELLVVMVIIGLLAALVTPKFIRQEEKAKVKAARAQVELLGAALDTFRLDVGRYPTSQEGLEALRQRPSGLERWAGPYLPKEVPRDIRVTPDQVVLCLSRRVACVSRLMVPETARGSLRQIIDYEVERLLPFPKEEIYYDYLTYEASGEERRLGVVIFGLPRRVVDEHLEVLAHAQIRPQMITVSSSAVVSASAFCGPLSEGPSVLVVLDDGEIELNFIEKRRLVASHLCSLARVQREGEWTDLLAQMVARNLPGASLEEVPIFSWGTNGLLPPSVGVQHDLHALAAARFVTDDGEPLLPAALPALGAALQAVGEDVAGINLLPVDKRARR